MYATVAPVLNTDIKYLFKVTNLPYMVIYLIQHYLHEIAFLILFLFNIVISDPSFESELHSGQNS